jgi:hypothetical protein
MSENDVLALLIAATAAVQLTRLTLAHRRAVKAAAVKAEWQSYLKKGASDA